MMLLRIIRKSLEMRKSSLNKYRGYLFGQLEFANKFEHRRFYKKYIQEELERNSRHLQSVEKWLKRYT